MRPRFKVLKPSSLDEITYVALKYDAASDDPDEDWRLIRQMIAEARPGWTFEYIDNLSWPDVEDLIDYMNGKAKANV